MPKADGAFGSASREALRGERNSTGARKRESRTAMIRPTRFTKERMLQGSPERTSGGLRMIDRRVRGGVSRADARL